MELVQLGEVQNVRALVGNVARFGGGLDYHGDESRAAGLSPVDGLLGCA